MRKFQKFGTALTLAGFVAAGMLTSSARLQAAGPGNGRSGQVLCNLLQAAYNVGVTAGLDDLAAAAKAQAVSLGCEWAAAQ